MDRSASFISDYRLTRVQERNGPVWLFLPGGAGLGSECFDSLLEVIDLPGSIYLLDYPGDGSNPKPLRPDHWKQGLLDVVKAFDHVHLVAHSFGAMFVMTIPELEDELQALVLMDGSPKKLTHHHGGPSNLKVEFPELLPKYVTAGQLERARTLFHDLPYNDQAFLWVRDHFHPDFKPSFVPTKIPALLLTGELDGITPFSNYNGTSYLNRSNILTRVIQGASHFPWLEKPDEVNQWLNLMGESVLTTDRLILRCLRTGDFPEVAELLADPQVMEYSLNGQLSKEQAEEYLNDRILAHYRKWGFGPWGIFDKSSGALMGMAGLVVREIDGQDQIEIAYRLFPRYWNRGYATEAAKSVRDWGFENLHVTQLVSMIEPSNVGSVRVAEKIGMKKESQTVFHGIPVDIYRVNTYSPD